MNYEKKLDMAVFTQRYHKRIGETCSYRAYSPKIELVAGDCIEVVYADTVETQRRINKKEEGFLGVFNCLNADHLLK